MVEMNRRSLLTGLISFAVTAPAIVRAASLMPVKSYQVFIGWDLASGEDMTAIFINKIYQNSHFGKLVNVRYFWSFEDNNKFKIFPIPDEDFYK